MGYSEDDSKPCLICGQPGPAMCMWHRRFIDGHEYCNNNLSYLEYKYKESING